MPNNCPCPFEVNRLCIGAVLNMVVKLRLIDTRADVVTESLTVVMIGVVVGMLADTELAPAAEVVTRE